MIAPICAPKGTTPPLPESCPVCDCPHSLVEDAVSSSGTISREYDCGALFEFDPRNSGDTFDLYAFDDEDIHDD